MLQYFLALSGRLSSGAGIFPDKILQNNSLYFRWYMGHWKTTDGEKDGRGFGVWFFRLSESVVESDTHAEMCTLVTLGGSFSVCRLSMKKCGIRS